MTPLISAQNIGQSFGGRQLFKDLSFGIFPGDKIGLIGPNGSGKSTLLKTLAGIEKIDEGTIAKQRSAKIGYVPQETLFPDKSLQDILFDSFEEADSLTDEQKQTVIQITLGKLDFPSTTISASSLSGGWQKRLAIAKELIHNPDVLFLDEPTNHLDLEGVIWLENFLRSAPFAYVVISHDRYFLEHVTNNMMELDRTYPNGMFAIKGSYSQFLEKKEEFLSGQIQQERSLSSKVRREVEWLKQNPKARTTKSSSRIQEAGRLIEELQGLKTRNKESKTQFDFATSKKETQKLLVATNLAKTMGNRNLFSGIHLTLTPGMRLGIVGLNGSGKTTLLRILAGELSPDKGTIKRADGIRVVYFDQHRAQLPSNITLREALAPQGESVQYRNQTIHVNSWCKRFLFSPDRLDLPFQYLSGGEKARVYIARLMLEPADILLLDEPTNDLDIPTLEVLESNLNEFPGAIVMISHDRYMLDQISNVILGLGTDDVEMNLFADYRQFEQHQLKLKEKKREPDPIKDEKKEGSPTKTRADKMTYNEKREWEQMENKISVVEAEIDKLQALIQDPSVATQPLKLQDACAQLDEKQTLRDALYLRWEELEQKAAVPFKNP